MGIAFNGREVGGLAFNGREIESGYINGRKVFPSQIDYDEINFGVFEYTITQPNTKVSFTVQHEGVFEAESNGIVYKYSTDKSHQVEFSYAKPGVYKVQIKGNATKFTFYDDCNATSYLTWVYYLNFQNISHTSRFFYQCHKLRGVDKLILLGGQVDLFYFCESLEYIGYIETTKGTPANGGPNLKKVGTAICHDGSLSFASDYKLESIDKIEFTGGYFSHCFSDCHNLKTVKEITLNFIDTKGNSEIYIEKMFENCESLEGFGSFIINSQENLSIYADLMFSHCYLLKEFPIDISSFYTLREMFSYCYSLYKDQALELDLKNVGTAEKMFSNCNGFTSVNINILMAASPFASGKYEDYINNMFEYCGNLKHVTKFVCKRQSNSSASTCNKIFYGCTSLVSISDIYIDLLNKTKSTHLFAECTSLKTAVNLNIKNAIDVSNMFLNCTSLETVQDITAEGSGLIAMFMFRNCSSLSIIRNITFPSLSDKYNVIFYDCPRLKYIKFGGTFRPNTRYISSTVPVQILEFDIVNLRDASDLPYSVSTINANSVIDGIYLGGNSVWMKNKGPYSLFSKVSTTGGSVYQDSFSVLDGHINTLYSRNWSVFVGPYVTNVWYEDSRGEAWRKEHGQFKD